MVNKVKRKMDKILEKAVKQELCEMFGFDEGRGYYALLTNQKDKFEKLFNKSKSYRIYLSMYDKGLLGKKTGEKKWVTYFLLPIQLENKEIHNAVKDIYLKNHKKQFNGVFQFSARKIEILEDFAKKNNIKLKYLHYNPDDKIEYVGVMKK
jgi:hypothetical protein